MSVRISPLREGRRNAGRLGSRDSSSFRAMARRKGEDTPDRKRRRMPFMAKIRRDDPFRSADLREIDAMCRRIAAASEYCSFAGWREDTGYLVYHFTTWAKARAMQHWIDRSGIAHRPMPKLGPTPQEVAEEKRQALAWGMETGAVRDVVQAYRRARHAGDGELTAFNAACDVAKALGRPSGEVQHTAKVLLEWAMDNHREWFYRFDAPAGAAPKSMRPVGAKSRPAIDDGPPLPRHSPRF
jgi:hypothetical protein